MEVTRWDDIIRDACEQAGIAYDSRARAWGEEQRRALVDYLEAPEGSGAQESARLRFLETDLGRCFRNHSERAEPC